MLHNTNVHTIICQTLNGPELKKDENFKLKQLDLQLLL